MTIKKIRVKEVCKIQRASGREYPKGTIYLQVSASDKKIKILQEEKTLESKYVVFLTDMNSEYLFICMERTENIFYEKYVGKNINIQVESLDKWEIEMHTDEEIQNKIVEQQKKAKQELEREEQILNALKELKKTMLKGMFPN